MSLNSATLNLTQVKSVVIYVLGLASVVIGAIPQVGVPIAVHSVLIAVGGGIIAVERYLQGNAAGATVLAAGGLTWSNFKSVAIYVIGFALVVLGAIPQTSVSLAVHTTMVAVGGVLAAVERYLQGSATAAVAQLKHPPSS